MDWEGDAISTTRGDGDTSHGGEGMSPRNSAFNSFTDDSASSPNVHRWDEHAMDSFSTLSPSLRDSVIAEDSDVIEWIRSTNESDEESGELTPQKLASFSSSATSAALYSTGVTTTNSATSTAQEVDDDDDDDDQENGRSGSLTTDKSSKMSHDDMTVTVGNSSRRFQRSGRGGGASSAPTHDVPVGSEMTLLIQMEFCGRTLRDMLRHVGGRQHHRARSAGSDQSASASTTIEERTEGDAEYVDHVLRVLLHVARALHHVHHVHGMVHRDLKPQNIFVMRHEKDAAAPFGFLSDWHHWLTGTEVVKLGDFGLSRHTNRSTGAEGGGKKAAASSSSSSPSSPFATRKKQLVDAANAETEQMSSGVGTLLYMSPEQARGGAYDAKTDIFSLGLIFFELGARVFSTMMERVTTMMAVRERNPVVLKAWPLGQACKGALELLTELLAENPTKRPSSSDVISRLQFLRGVRVLHRREGEQVRGTTIRVEAEVREGEEDFGAQLLSKINATVLKHPSVNVTDIGLRQSSHHATVELVVDATEQDPVERLLETLRAVSDRVTRAIAV
jgi:serine/threonine protein kinase